MKAPFLRFITVCVFWAIHLNGNCSNSDSLYYHKSIIQGESKSEALINSYKWLLNNYVTVDIDSSEYYGRLALNHFKKRKDKKGQAFALTSISKILLFKNQLVEAQNYALKAIEIAIDLNDKNREGLGYELLARIQDESNNSKDAVYYFNKAILTLEEAEDHTSLGMVYVDLGSFYNDNGDNEKAILYYQKALSEYKLAKSKVGEINCLNGLASIYYENDDLKRFWSLTQKSIKLAREHFKGKTNTLELSGYATLAIYYYEIGEYDSASIYLKRYNQGNKHIGNTTKLPEGYEFLAEVDFLSKRYKEAYKNLMLSMQITDSLRNQADLEEVVKIQRKYNFEKEEKKRINAELSAVKANEQRIIYLFLALATVLVAIILVLTYRSRIEKGKKELLLKEQKINELLKNQEIRALDMMMEWQEKERKRVAKDLHDRLGSMLSTIKLQFSSMEGKIEKIREENASQFSLTCNLLDEAVEEVRRVSHNMISGTLTKFGLVPALEDLANNIMASGQISCELIVSHMEERLSGNQEIMIYRMIQECVSNALKHSQAKSLIIQLIRHDEELTVMVEDDGVGFKLDDAKEKKGLGLSNVESRVKQLNGRCTFDTAPGQGTTIIAEIPLKDS